MTAEEHFGIALKKVMEANKAHREHDLETIKSQKITIDSLRKKIQSIEWALDRDEMILYD